MARDNTIDSVDAFIDKVRKDYQAWGLGKRPWFPWFRGEPACETHLVPRLYRSYYIELFGGDFFENRILQHFRARAMAYGNTPRREEIDVWLFLAQHVGLPTRLLDWTESSLDALYFALQEKKPVVWMLNPFVLNKIVEKPEKSREVREGDYNIYALTWFPGSEEVKNIAHQNLRAAWQGGQGATELPFAISPTYIHPRIPAQKGRFTVHGSKQKGLDELLDEKDKDIVLKKYVIDASATRQTMLDELQVLGVSRAGLFPDLDGLSKDLTELFRPDVATWIKRVEQSV